MPIAQNLIAIGLPPAQSEVLGYSNLTQVTASGTSPGTATAIKKYVTQVEVTASLGSTGVILPSEADFQQDYLVVNTSATTVFVYPPDGSTINSLTINSPVSVGTNVTAIFARLDRTRWNSFDNTPQSGGSIDSISVATANGLAGSSSGGSTPTVTLSTTVNGLVQGDGTTLSAASTTGTGSVVRATSPTLVTPNLGIPSAIDLTNATNFALSGLPKGTSGYALIGNGASASTYQGFTQGGTGSVTRDWLTKVRSVQVNIVIDYGADSTGVASSSTAIQNALDYVHSLGGGVVWAPPGTYLQTATLICYAGTALLGAGFGNTIFTRTGNYGNTLELGTALQHAQSVNVSGIWFIHQHTYVPGVTTTLDNPVSAGTKHIWLRSGQDAQITDCWFFYLPYQVYIDGGTKVTVANNNYVGIWDPAYAGLQEGVAAIALVRGTLDSGIPTVINLLDNFLGGTASEDRPLYFGLGTQLAATTAGPFPIKGAWTTTTGYSVKDRVTVGSQNYVCSQANTSSAADQPGIGINWPNYWQIWGHANIGSKYSVYAETFEVLNISGGYIGANAASGIYFNPVYIASGNTVSNIYFDGSTDAQITYHANDTSFVINSIVSGCNFFGTSQTYNAINAEGGATLPSVASLIVNACSMREDVATPMKLSGAVGSIVSNCIIFGYNYYNLSTDTTHPEYSSGVYIVGQGAGTGASHHLTVSNNIFGGNGSLFSTSGNNCGFGVYTAAVGSNSDIQTLLNSGISLRYAVASGDIIYQDVTTSGFAVVGSLFPAATAGAGARAFVTDATATTFHSIVAGGGANKVPVVSDGTNWLIG